MISLSKEQLEKINLIDNLFSSVSIDSLRKISESEEIVARLKGLPENPQILLKMIRDNDSHIVAEHELRAEIIILKEDIKGILRIFDTLFQTPYSQELHNLKSRYGIY